MNEFISLNEAIGAFLTEDIYDPGHLDGEGRPILLAKIGDKVQREMVTLFEKIGLELIPTNKGVLILNALRFDDEEILGVSSMQVRKAPQGLWPSEQLIINGKVRETRYTKLGGSKAYVLDTWWKSFSQFGGVGLVGRYI